MWQSLADIISRMDRAAGCESPIERTMVVILHRALVPGTQIILQAGIQTRCGDFRLDMLVRQGNRQIGIECDGQDFHDVERDRWRDALILATGRVESLFRFTGSEIYNLGIHCLYDLVLVYPQLFQPEIRRQHWPHIDAAHCIATRRARFGINRLGQQCFGKDLYQFARCHPGIELDQIIEMYREQHPEPKETEELFDLIF